jgi:hypothetical protein
MPSNNCKIHEKVENRGHQNKIWRKKLLNAKSVLNFGHLTDIFFFVSQTPNYYFIFLFVQKYGIN